MRFLADESCDFSVVRALRTARHDVGAVAEVAPGAPDEIVIDLALRDKRILLTEDKDFGQLVYAAGKTSVGVILIRFPASARAALPQAILDLIKAQKEQLVGCFAVVQPSRVRISRGPKL